MPRRKSPVKLPQVPNIPRIEEAVADEKVDVGAVSEPSTQIPPTASVSRSIAESSAALSELPFSLSSDGLEDWPVQDAKEILADTKQRVLARNRWNRDLLEYSALEKRRHRDREQANLGYHIILPDNRVRAMDDALSRSVRAQLLNEELPPESLATPLPPPKRVDETRGGGRGRRPRQRCHNPWYLHPHKWYNPHALKDPDEPISLGFPYEEEILNGTAQVPTGPVSQSGLSVADGMTPDVELRPLTQKEIEELPVIKMYRIHMAGKRLPHFLC